MLARPRWMMRGPLKELYVGRISRKQSTTKKATYNVEARSCREGLESLLGQTLALKSRGQGTVIQDG